MPQTNKAAPEIASLFRRHAPDLWRNELSPSRAAALLGRDAPANMIVMAADVRSSTLLMKEAIDFHRFATIMGNFVDSVRKVVRRRRGWFDKFTGDGFLAFWIVDDRPIDIYFKEVLATAEGIIETFKLIAEPELRRNSRNFPNRVGMSIGIDSGQAHLVQIADALTIVGHPVVGAVRMVACAEPHEIICNMAFGHQLLTVPELLQTEGVGIEAARRDSKDYAGGQEVFTLTLESLTRIAMLEISKRRSR